jgi:hypothetical protein
VSGALKLALSLWGLVSRALVGVFGLSLSLWGRLPLLYPGSVVPARARVAELLELVW